MREEKRVVSNRNNLITVMVSRGGKLSLDHKPGVWGQLSPIIKGRIAIRKF